MAEFRVGDKVTYRNMTMPAEILSGPHKSPGRDRYLVRKADGNVSLVSVTVLERVFPRVEQMAGTLAVVLYGRTFAMLDPHTKLKLAEAARRTLLIADKTRGQA
jgi:hypothetical protein